MEETKALLIINEAIAKRIFNGKRMDAEATAEAKRAFDAPRQPLAGDTAIWLDDDVAKDWREAMNHPERDIDPVLAVRLRGSFALSIGAVLELDNSWKPL
jgi:hypothetical protein